MTRAERHAVLEQYINISASRYHSPSFRELRWRLGIPVSTLHNDIKYLEDARRIARNEYGEFIPTMIPLPWQPSPKAARFAGSGAGL